MASTCTGPNCGAEIIWAKTAKGKKVPLNAKPEKRYLARSATDSTVELRNAYVPHHATCPDVGSFKDK